jgi:small-conductance mechanosensitive channel
MDNPNRFAILVDIVGAMPGPMLAVAILAFCVACALILFSLAVKLLRRFVKPHHPLFWSYLRRTGGPIRFALILLAMSIGVRLVPLEPDAASLLAQIFQLGVIVLIGWLAIVGLDMTADAYLARFRIDLPDNLLARKHVTQVRVLRRALQTVTILITLAAGLMTFDTVRQIGLSLFASAGIAGIVVGLAARPLLSSLIAGVQIAVTQPIRIDDAVVVEGEWGWIEEITATYVVIKLWDWRRLIVPLSYFMEKPFQNWTRETASIIGSVILYVDYTAPVAAIRAKLDEIVRSSALWDGQVVNLQVTNATERAIELRALVSARTSPAAWDLRCEVREKLLTFMQSEYPHSLPQLRMSVADRDVVGKEVAGKENGGSAAPPFPQKPLV